MNSPGYSVSVAVTLGCVDETTMKVKGHQGFREVAQITFQCACHRVCFPTLDIGQIDAENQNIKISSRTVGDVIQDFIVGKRDLASIPGQVE